MRTLGFVTKAQMKHNKKRTLANILSIALCTMLITTLFGLFVSLRFAVRDSIISRSGEWHFFVIGVNQEQISNLKQDGRITITDSNNEVDTARIMLNGITFSYEADVEDILRDAGVQHFMFDAPSNGVTVLAQRALLLIDGIWNGTNAIIFISAIALILLLVAAGIGSVIKNTFEISINSNIHELGMLRSEGATPRQIFKIVFAEINYLAIAAIPVGILLGLLVQQLCIVVANSGFASLGNIGIAPIQMQGHISFGIIIVIIIYVYIVLLYAVFRLIKKLNKLDIISTLTGAQNLSVPKEKTKFPKTLFKVFGMQGVLAYKNRKRNPRQYRAVTRALVLGVAFFIVSAGLGQTIVAIAERNFPLDDFNVSITVNSIAPSGMAAIESELLKIPNQHNNMGVINFSSGTRITLDDYTGEALENVPFLQIIGETVGAGVVIRAVDDASFAKLCADANVAGYTSNMPWGIVYNDYTYETEGNQVTIQLYNFTAGDTIILNNGNNPEVQIASVQLGPSPFYEDRYSDIIKIYMSRNSLSPLIEPLTGQTNSYVYRVQAQNPAEFETAARKILENTLGIPAGNISIVNYSAQSGAYRTILSLIVFFAAIIVILVAVVAVSNIFVVVDYNLTTRKREFAMLRSIGMPQSGLKHMLIFDSVWYFIKPLFVGIPLGIVPIAALYFIIRKAFAVAFSLPIVPILLCIGVLVCLMAVLALYSISKVKRMKIMPDIICADF